MTDNERMSSSRQPSFVTMSLIVLGTAFVSGIVAGYLDGSREAGDAAPSTAIGMATTFAAGTAVLIGYLSRFGRFWEAWSRRKRFYTISLLLSAALGFFSYTIARLGVQEGETADVFGNGAFDPTVAVILSLLWVGGMAVSLILYHRGVDDHEKQAYLWGGLAGFYAIVFPAPIWWLLARADLMPPLDGMILFLLAVIANGVVYMWLKFR